MPALPRSGLSSTLHNVTYQNVTRQACAAAASLDGTDRCTSLQIVSRQDSPRLPCLTGRTAGELAVPTCARGTLVLVPFTGSVTLNLDTGQAFRNVTGTPISTPWPFF